MKRIVVSVRWRTQTSFRVVKFLGADLAAIVIA
jgi:hypothetical protein